jgi:hypothetical protein
LNEKQTSATDLTSISLAPAGQVYAATGEAAGYEAQIVRLPDLNVTIIALFNRSPTAPAYDFIIENGLGLLEN